MWNLYGKYHIPWDAGNGGSLGSYLVKNDVFNQKGWKQADKNSSGSQSCEPFYLASPEKIEVKVFYRQTDRQATIL